MAPYTALPERKWLQDMLPATLYAFRKTGKLFTGLIHSGFMHIIKVLGQEQPSRRSYIGLLAEHYLPIAASGAISPIRIETDALSHMIYKIILAASWCRPLSGRISAI